MADAGTNSRPKQRVWAAILLGIVIGAGVVAYVLRDTELVNPDVVQRGWLEFKEVRTPQR